MIDRLGYTTQHKFEFVEFDFSNYIVLDIMCHGYIKSQSIGFVP